MISKRNIEDVRFANDIVDVIGSYLTLKRAGGSFKALCPFHKEKTPSLHVNQQRQSFHCFGCGKGGDVFRFVQDYENVDFLTSVRLLAQRAGISIDWEEADDAASHERKALLEIHAGIAEFYQRCLTQLQSAASAREYLARRDLIGDATSGFQIGYAPPGWDAAIQWAGQHNYSLELMEKAGLILQSSRSDARQKYYDRFRNRIMFPVQDEQGRVIGFSGRTLEQDPKAAKYVNSPETVLFKKSRILYAIDKARRAIADAGEAMVCEGQIDVIRCHLAGFETAVACQGTAFTEDHARVLRRYADCVVLVFDTDSAGQNAAIKAAGIFMEAGLAVRVARLPQGEDPDSFLRAHGVDAFRELLKQAVSAVVFQISVLAGRENVKSEIGTMRVARAVLQTILRTPNAVQQARLLQEAAERLNVPASALQEELRHLERRHAAVRKPEGAPFSVSAASRHPPEEEALCEYLLQGFDHPELVEAVSEHLPFAMWQDEQCRLLAQAAMEACKTGQNVADILRAGEGDESLLTFAAKLQASPGKVSGREVTKLDAVHDLILRIWKRDLLRRRQALLNASGETNPSGEDSRITELAELTSQMKQLDHWSTGELLIRLECMS